MKLNVVKSILISASIEEIRKHIDDFEQWKAWSPWMVIEPECSNAVSGEAGKPGHSMRWDGKIIGSGTNTLTASTMNSLAYDLVFLTPWKSEAKTTFTFTEKNGATEVTWYLDSRMPFFLFFMVRTMDNMIGMDYDRGLRMLKSVVEKGHVPATTTSKGEVQIEGFSYVGLQRTVPMKDLPTEMMKDFGKLAQDIVIDGGKSAKNWVALYPKVDMKNMMFTYIAAASDEAIGDLALGDEYVRGTVEAGNALEIGHDGAYEFLGNAWATGMMMMRALKMKGRGVPYEHYWNSPREVAPEELKTSIFFPLR